MEEKSNIVPLLNEEDNLRINVVKAIRAQNSELTYEQAFDLYLETFPEMNPKSDQKKLIKALFRNQREIAGRLNQLIQGLQNESNKISSLEQ